MTLECEALVKSRHKWHGALKTTPDNYEEWWESTGSDECAMCAFWDPERTGQAQGCYGCPLRDTDPVKGFCHSSWDYIYNHWPLDYNTFIQRAQIIYDEIASIIRRDYSDEIKLGD